MQKINIEYTIHCLPEDTEIRGNVLASGDPNEDSAAEQEVIAQLNSGNEWAWCTVQVIAKIDGIGVIGSDYLGCYSCKSQEDFEQCGYLEDMKNNARAELLRELRDLKRALIELDLDEVQS